MNAPGFAFANLGWLAPVTAVWALAVGTTLLSHGRLARAQRSALGLGLRLLAITVLALALLEPTWARPIARPGANSFAVLVDDSRSIRLAGTSANSSVEALRAPLATDTAWATRIGETYQLRRYRFDARLERVSDFAGLQWDGRASHLASALRTLSERYRGAPLGGILLFSDGNATDVEQLDHGGLDLAGLPPIYPVVMGGSTSVRDVSVAHVSASETLFEDAPVSIEARLESSGVRGRVVTAELLDERDQVVARQTFTPSSDQDLRSLAFRVRPATPPPAKPATNGQPGASSVTPNKTAGPATTRAVHYRVTVALPPGVSEATVANNARSVLVPRPQGRARLLYVGGRPNWEYKFLRRALEGDRQLELAALVRAAAREPKFAFLTRKGESINPLYRGFGATADDAERFDEPVLVRLGMRDAEELRGGFPKTPEELFAYQAIVIDDMEASFFSAAQQSLIDRFVSERGGGLLMLGGIASFRQGGYDRTPIGDLLPVYLGSPREAERASAALPRRFVLSREGWLEAWMRLRDSESAERTRLDAMPAFQVASRSNGIKPGAMVLARLVAGKSELPALVMQRAGEGRTAALTVGDLWRWGLHRPPGEADDLAKFWRQTMRALVSDVPPPVSVTLAPRAGDAGALAIRAKVRGRDFRPSDGALVEMEAVAPDGTRSKLVSEPASTEPGAYDAVYRPGGAGIHHVQVRATGADGQLLGEAEAGRAIDLDADEHRSVRPNLALLSEIARTTGGSVIAAADLDGWAARMRDRPAPITDLQIRPLWHSWVVLLFALACVAAEWTLRRRRGLP